MEGRSTPGGRITKILVFANVLIFAAEALFGQSVVLSLNRIFGLSTAGLADGWWWQLVTHQFLHGNGVHLFVNMLMLWFVGRDMEEVLGGMGYLGLYIGGGIAGGLFQMLFLTPGGVLIGASGSVCAVLLALTAMFPKVPVTALLFFVIPVRLKAGVLGVVLVVGSILLWILGLAPGIGHAAHLGGFAFGYFYAIGFRLRQAHRQNSAHDTMRESGWNERMEPNLPDVSTRDEVVEKLLRHGLSSLSKEEIRLLESPRPSVRSRWK